MNVNPTILPVLSLGIAAFLGGIWVAERTVAAPWRWAIYLPAALLAVPGVLLTLYYLHWFDGAQWFYAFRTLRYTELTAAGLGVIAGMLPALLRRRLAVVAAQAAALILLVSWLSVPYLKMIFGPIDLTAFEDRVVKGVVMQSTGCSCGPAAAATLASTTGIYVSEKELARAGYTTQSGTECWYLARALQRNGLSVHYVFLPSPAPQLLYRSIAGVRMGGPHGPGHFVAVLEDTGKEYVIADPAAGKVLVKKSMLNSGDYYFSGFFMLVTRD